MSWDLSIIHLPRPMTLDSAAITVGRERALRQYRDARTNRERVTALIWVNHWRWLHDLSRGHETIEARRQ